MDLTGGADPPNCMVDYCATETETLGSCPDGGGGDDPDPTSCSVDYCRELWGGTVYAACSETTGWGDYSCGPDREYYGARDTDDCNTDPDNYCVCCGPPGSLSPSCDLSANPDSGFTPLSTNLSMSAEGSNLNSWQLTYGDGAQECNPGPCSGNPDGLTRNHNYSTGNYTATMTLWNQAGESTVCSDDVEVGLPAPQNLRNTDNTPHTLDWAWDPVSGATSYKVYLLYESGPTFFLRDTVVGTTFHQDVRPWFSIFTGITWWPIGGFLATWNWPYSISVQACNGISCSSARAFSTAATSIESPTLITKVSEILNGANSNLKIRVNSDERWYTGTYFGFSELNKVNSAVRVRIRRLPSGFGEFTTGWRSGPGAFGRPADFDFFGLLEGSEYELCAQSRNRDGLDNNSGDYRPGPTSSDWNCENFFVGPVIASCTPDTDQVCCENQLANVDLTATRSLAPGLTCTGATGNSCWAPAGGFSFPQPQSGETYHANCCGDDLGEVFDGGNASCDGTHACCSFGSYVEGGNCVAACNVNQPTETPEIEPPISFEGSITPSKIASCETCGLDQKIGLSKKKTSFLSDLSAHLFHFITHNVFK